ncbi:MAG: S1C family serine protease [Acidimicrobiales bacterium]
MIRPLAMLVVALSALVACQAGDDDDSDGATRARGATAPRVDERAGDGGVFGRIPDVVREVEPSVVAILTDRGEGSGVIWDQDGTIVTNHHVVAQATDPEVAFADGKRSPADLVASDPITDLAVLSADRDGLPAAEPARTLPEVGELAIAIGNPLGFENTVTAGIVSGLHRSIPGSARTTPALVDLIQTDAPISPGNSGGALVDADGRIIGINVAYIPPAARAVSIGFAIPAPTVRDVVGQLLDDGDVSHAFLGIRPAPLTPEIASRLGADVDAGVVVLDVVSGGPAEDAGMTPGDVITAIDDQQIDTVEDLLATLRDHAPGDEITVAVAREGDTVELTVTLTDRPQTG